jgi:hypothetical protein
VADVPKPDGADRDVERGGKLGNGYALGTQCFRGLPINLLVIGRRAAATVFPLGACYFLEWRTFLPCHEA